MNGLASALMAWMAMNSSYDTANLPNPEIIPMTPIVLTAATYSDTPGLIPDSRVGNCALALSRFEDRASVTVNLLALEQPDAPIDPDEQSEIDPPFEEHLLHELVHQVQRKLEANDSSPCCKLSEGQAYQLGGKYLCHRNVEDPLPNRNFWAHFYSRC